MPASLVKRHTTYVVPMQWHHVSMTRAHIDETEDDDSKPGVLAWLIGDGSQLQSRVWVRVPLHHGLKRAVTVDDLDTDVWFDAARGIASTTSDLTGRTLHVDRFPLDASQKLEHAFTFVFTRQRAAGPNVHPLNETITRMAPDLASPWRGNVLVFRHGKTAKKVIVNVEEKYWAGITWIISNVFPQLGPSDLSAA